MWSDPAHGALLEVFFLLGKCFVKMAQSWTERLKPWLRNANRAAGILEHQLRQH